MIRKELERVKIWKDYRKIGGKGCHLNINEMVDFKFFLGVLWYSFIKCTDCKCTSVVNCETSIVVRVENEELDWCYDGVSWSCSWDVDGVDVKRFELYLEGMIQNLTSEASIEVLKY
jgi:hypothetical protein